MEETQAIHSDHSTRAAADFNSSATPIHNKPAAAVSSEKEGDESSCRSTESVMSESQEAYESHSSTYDKDEEEPKPDEFVPAFSLHEDQHLVMAHHHDCCSSTTASTLKSVIRCDDIKLEYVKVEGPWRKLPILDLNRIQQQRINLRDRSVVLQGGRDRAHRGMNVVFDSVKIRSYSQTLGDNPCVSYGPPIQLDWDYEDGAPVPIDEFECERRSHRPRRMQALALNYYQRCNVLTYYCGVSVTDIKTAQKEAAKITRQRNFTKMTLPCMIVEDMLESAGRKAKRLQTSIFGDCVTS